MLNRNQTLLYCLGVSIYFVTSLYLFVPKKVRQLDRNDVEQIQWRMICVMMVSIGCRFLLYPYLYLTKEEERFFFWHGKKRDILCIIFHTISLFLGPLYALALRILKRKTAYNYEKRGIGYHKAFYEELIQPSIASPSNSWAKIRDIGIAPIAEEIVFRGCMAGPLLCSGYTIGQVSFLAPIFFGMAHFHHGYIKIQQGLMPIPVVITSTVVHFAVTYLFGVYSCFAFIKSGSLVVVVICHSFCNAMGLPDLSFLSKYSMLYPYRVSIMFVYVCGIVLFVLGFITDYVFHPGYAISLPC